MSRQEFPIDMRSEKPLSRETNCFIRSIAGRQEVDKRDSTCTECAKHILSLVETLPYYILWLCCRSYVVRKIMALALAMVMVLAMSMTVFAGGGVEPEPEPEPAAAETVSITVHRDTTTYEGEAAEDSRNFTWYRVFTASYSVHLSSE